jgi:hypothetical protein
MKQKFLIGAVVVALGAAVAPLAGLARQGTARGSAEVPFAELVGENCTAWVGGHRAESNHYAGRAGGIWTADNGIVAVSGKLRQVRGGWAQFVTSAEEQTWVPLDRIIALQADVEIMVPQGATIMDGPGVRVRRPGPDR